MTDKPALYEMKDAPTDDLLFVWGAVGCQNSGNGLVYGFRVQFLDKYQPQDGFLPIPSEASSKAVASNAGKHFDVCSDEDVAAEIRRQLRRPGVREALGRAVVKAGGIYQWQDVEYYIEQIAQEPTND